MPKRARRNLADNFDSLDRNDCIVTLGPEGTDAHVAARRLSDNVELAQSFEDAMSTAAQRDWVAMVACGFISRNGQGRVDDTWVDLHFRWQSTMAILAAGWLPTQEMAIAAVRRDMDLQSIGSLAIHPATESLANTYCKAERYIYCTSKPDAVRRVLLGEADACLGSSSYISRSTSLRKLATFTATMVWALYSRA